MAKSRNLRAEALSTIYSLIDAGGSRDSSLLIVDTTIITKLLNAMALADLQKFIEVELHDAPDPSDRRFPAWIRTTRIRADLTQKEFAELLTNKAKLKIHQSDIGNIESGFRKGDYTLERLHDLRRAILQYIPISTLQP